MALPEFQMMMRPVLAALDDGREWPSGEIRALLAAEFSLTERDLAERTSTGKNRYINTVAWALHHLSRALLVEKVAPSVYRITQRGLLSAA